MLFDEEDPNWISVVPSYQRFGEHPEKQFGQGGKLRKLERNNTQRCQRLFLHHFTLSGTVFLGLQDTGEAELS